MTGFDKRTLFERGVDLHVDFCRANHLRPPPVIESDLPGRLGTCAFYRPDRIVITVAKCAAVGLAGASWSFPGYVIDRTPYGVLQHEQGHAVDVLCGGGRAYYSGFSAAVRKMSGEAKLTNYCPNDAEWFAEMFRLFVTNSDLLRVVRPRTYGILRGYFRPVVDRPWRVILEGAPDRVFDQVIRKAAA